MLDAGLTQQRREFVVVGRTLSNASGASSGFRGASTGLYSSPALPVLPSSGLSPATICWTGRENHVSPQLTTTSLSSTQQPHLVATTVGKVPPIPLGAQTPQGVLYGDTDNGVSETTESELDGNCIMPGTARSSDFTSDVSTADGVSIRPSCCHAQRVDTGAGVVEWLFRDCMSDLAEESCEDSADVESTDSTCIDGKRPAGARHEKAKVMEVDSVPDEVHPTARKDAMETHPSREPSCLSWAGASCKGCCGYCKRVDISSGGDMANDGQSEVVVPNGVSRDVDVALHPGPEALRITGSVSS